MHITSINEVEELLEIEARLPCSMEWSMIGEVFYASRPMGLSCELFIVPEIVVYMLKYWMNLRQFGFCQALNRHCC